MGIFRRRKPQPVATATVQPRTQFYSTPPRPLPNQSQPSPLAYMGLMDPDTSGLAAAALITNDPVLNTVVEMEVLTDMVTDSIQPDCSPSYDTSSYDSGSSYSYDSGSSYDCGSSSSFDSGGW